MNNPFVKSKAAKLCKLLQQYEDHGKIVVGIDFDFTLYDSTKAYTDNAFYDDILSLVKRAQSSGACTLCLWTASGDVEGVIEATNSVGIYWDYINESPLVFRDPAPRKPHFNLLLDDSAGLGEAVKTLQLFLDTVQS